MARSFADSVTPLQEKSADRRKRLSHLGHEILIVVTLAACSDCGAPIQESALSCPSCHALTHAKELESLAAQAQQAMARGRRRGGARVLGTVRFAAAAGYRSVPGHPRAYRESQKHTAAARKQMVEKRRGRHRTCPPAAVHERQAAAARSDQAQHAAVDAGVRRRVLGALRMDVRGRHGVFDLHP